MYLSIKGSFFWLVIPDFVKRSTVQYCIPEYESMQIAVPVGFPGAAQGLVPCRNMTQVYSKRGLFPQELSNPSPHSDSSNVSNKRWTAWLKDIRFRSGSRTHQQLGASSSCDQGCLRSGSTDACSHPKPIELLLPQNTCRFHDYEAACSLWSQELQNPSSLCSVVLLHSSDWAWPKSIRYTCRRELCRRRLFGLMISQCSTPAFSLFIVLGCIRFDPKVASLPRWYLHGSDDVTISSAL